MRRRVVEDDARMVGVADVVPEPAVAMAAPRLVAHRHRGVVGVQHLRLQHPVLEQLPQGCQQLGARRHPVAHRRARQLAPEPLEALLAAMQRNVILILVDDDLGQQARPRQALVDRLRRLGGDGHVAFAALAGVLDALVLDDEHLGRLVVVLLGRLDADLLTLVAALGAEPFGRGQFVTSRFVAQVRGPADAGHAACSGRAGALCSAPAAAAVAARREGGSSGKSSGWLGSTGFGPRAVQPPQQGIEPLLHLGFVATRPPQGAQQLGDHLLEHGRVVGEGRRVDGRRRGALRERRAGPGRCRVQSPGRGQRGQAPTR